MMRYWKYPLGVSLLEPKMTYARTIRTAVTALLIVAMTIQPVSAFAFAGPCPAENAELESVCAGCGCCDVKEPAQRCDCCTRESDEKADRGGHQAKSDLVQPEADLSGACHCAIQVPPMNHDGQRHESVRPVIQRVVFETALTVHVVRPAQPPLVVHGASHSTGSRSDFSQRFLGVWRI
jgi:hypothetical protein